MIKDGYGEAFSMSGLSKLAYPKFLHHVKDFVKNNWIINCRWY